MIKYKFAYNSNKRIINISHLSKENISKLDQFTCLSCECEMVAVLGKKRAKHFRHKVINKEDCSQETYLHKLAKIKFYDTYQNCLDNHKPFKINISTEKICNFYKEEFLRECQLDSELSEFDLTKFFKRVYLETKEGSFIPDVLLKANNDRDKLFFEVYVTHKSETSKIESGNRIIEFKVNSEDDIQIIESCVLTESEKVRFFNFQKIKTQKWCEGQCFKEIVPYAKEDILYTVFIVYKNGKSRLTSVSVQELETLNQSNILHIEYLSVPQGYDKITDYQRSELYKHQVVDCYSKGIKIKNCFLCKYHIINPFWYQHEGISCEFLTNGNSNQAVNCKYFRPDSKVFSKYHNNFYGGYEF